MGTRRSPVDRLVEIGLTRPDPDAAESHVLEDGHLHSDDDSICPRCLGWIDARQFVRRNGYGLLQHEVCPQA